jgi:hypothetical protein
MSRRAAFSSPLLIQRCLFLVSAALLLTVAGCGSATTGNSVASPANTPSQTPSAASQGPQLGYIWSTTAQTLRPVLGVPGSTQLGQSVVPANLYANAAASPISNLAVLVETDGALDLIALPSGTPARLAATPSPGAQIRLSPNGSNAIAFIPGSTAATLLTSLAATPQAAAVTFPAAINDAAVSDNATIAASLQSGSIRTLSKSGTANQAGTIANLGGLTFLTGSDDLLFADAAANTATIVRNSATAPASSIVPSANLLKSPAGAGVSRDGRYAVIANAADPSIVRLDLTAQTAPQRLACACQPALVTPMLGTGVFRVTGADTGPNWIVDASAPTPRVLFIPAIPQLTPASTVQEAQR